jgi:hypothetical protein
MPDPNDPFELSLEKLPLVLHRSKVRSRPANKWSLLSRPERVRVIIDSS